MVKHCVVFRCANQYNASAREKGVSFFRFPKDKRKRRAWVRAVNRKNWTPNNHSWICSEHFVDGWHGDEPSDLNYAPTIFSYKAPQLTPCKLFRDSRHHERSENKARIQESINNELRIEASKRFSVMTHSSYCSHDDANINTSSPAFEDTLSDTNIVITKSTGTQCDADPFLLENQQLKLENDTLKDQLKQHIWNTDKISNNDSMTRFYTGLPSFSVFMWLFNILSPKATRMTYWIGESSTPSSNKSRQHPSSLPLIDQFLSVLMRNKLGLFVQDIAYRFGISTGTFSKYYTTWICLIYEELKILNPFPSRDIIDRTMPSQFKTAYPSTRIIIDCTEIFIQKSSSLVNQSLTFSNFKSHNTIKFLIGITPAGAISFVSEGWGGRVSDRHLTEECGLLDLLEPGDSVMADRGFTISDLLSKRGCFLNIPPFRGNSNQFTTEEVYKTQEIASLRIHVERKIGRVKNFHIFDGILPLSLAPLATKLFHVCCWLTNLDTPLVEDKQQQESESSVS